MAEFTQEDRLLKLTTTAGDDVLLVDSIAGEEAISQPFRYVMKLMSKNAAQVQPHQLVGSSMTTRIQLSAPGTGVVQGERYWTGMCQSFVKEGQDDNFSYFSATLVPWFSFLDYATNCRIFQDQDATQIIQTIVGELGYAANFRMELSKTYSTRDYCVQYRETDFVFLSRVMESEGIYYYFEHTDGKHVMVLADAPSQNKSTPTVSSFKYSPITGMEDTEDTIRTWRVEEQIHTGKVTFRDFDHESPTSHYEVSTPSESVAAEGAKFELYDYPGGYAKKYNKADSASKVQTEGEKLNRDAVEREETFEISITGDSMCRAFTSGYKFDVTGGFAAGTYLLTGAQWTVYQLPAYSSEPGPRPGYRNAFRAIPATVPFVPPTVHGRNTVQGLQTALVIDESESGNTEEIWPDKYGRVRVRFPWDRDAKSACWLRVVQPWAGAKWGQQWIPRVGDEVAVTFLEGDPDVPIVIGSLYNGANLPMFTLPDNKTQSGLQTHSSPGGGSSNYNMLRFEDKNGDEEIYVQAEKDWNSLIKNNETRTVKNNRTTTIHVDESRTVETGNDTIAVQQGKRTITVNKDISVTSQTGNISTTATAGQISVTALKDISEESQTGNISIKALMNISESSTTGNVSIQATVGQVSISGLAGVTISCGASSISMTPASISISAPMVLINS